MKSLSLYSALLVLLIFAPRCFAQVIAIRVIDSANGRGLTKQNVSVSLLYEKTEKNPAKFDSVLHFKTDSKGEVRLSLPEPPPSHFAVRVNLSSPYHCGCNVLASTKEVVEKGILDSAADPKRPSRYTAPIPSEMIFVARPYSIFERLLSPLVKE